MSSPTTPSVRRRIALAAGAGALILVGGAGVAYAASSIDDAVGTGWSTVVDADPAADGNTGQDCPDQGSGGGSSSSTQGGQPDSSTASQAAPSQDGDL